MKPEALRIACHAKQLTPDQTTARGDSRKRTWIFHLSSSKSATPCKCCASITGRWWTGRPRRGTGRSAP